MWEAALTVALAFAPFFGATVLLARQYINVKQP